MAFFQYLVCDGENLPLPDSYEVELEDVEADSGGETEAGTTQRDVVRHGVVRIPVSFSVTAKWLKKLAGYAKLDKISVISVADIFAAAIENVYLDKPMSKIYD